MTERDHVEETKNEIAVFLGDRLTKLWEETGVRIYDLSIFTTEIRKVAGQPGKHIAVIEVMLHTEDNTRA